MKYLIVVLLLSGCGKINHTDPDGVYEVPFNRKCSTEQMQRVEKETTFCLDKKVFSEVACYSSAIQRICDAPK